MANIMVVSPPPQESPQKLLFQFPLKISVTLKGVLTELQLESAEILNEDHGQGVILIPPEGAVLYVSAHDMASSKKISQLQTQIEQFFQHHVWGVVILEGFHRWGESNRTTIQQILVSLFLSQAGSACPIMIPSRNAKDSAEILIRIAKREQIEDLPPILSRPRAKTVMLAKAQEFFIEGLLNCGPKKAKLLLTEFDSPNEIIRALLDHPEKFEQIKGLGKKFVEQNRQLLGQSLFSTQHLPQDGKDKEKDKVDDKENVKMKGEWNQ